MFVNHNINGDNMKYKEKALHLIKEIVIKKPFELFFKITSNNQGMNQILTMLNSNEKLYTPGELAKISNLTTARIAVVIKKLIKLGYVEKIRSMTDARVSYIVITLKGKTFIEEKND